MNDVSPAQRAMSNREWTNVLKESIDTEVIDGIRFPRFPPAEFQEMTVGGSNGHTLEEALVFYDEFKARAATAGKPLEADSRILDFGCSWGRFLRFFWRDVGAANLYGVDIDRDMVDTGERLGLPGTLRRIEPMGTLPFPDDYFSHAFSYSVFTHLPEHVALHWMAELARVTIPGGIFIFTAEPPRFLDFVEGIPDDATSGWHVGLKAALPDPAAAKAKAAAGNFVYLATGGGDQWTADVYGDAVVPEAYARTEWAKHFDILDYIDDPTKFWQAVIVARGHLKEIKASESSMTGGAFGRLKTAALRLRKTLRKALS